MVLLLPELAERREAVGRVGFTVCVNHPVTTGNSRWLWVGGYMLHTTLMACRDALKCLTGEWILPNNHSEHTQNGAKDQDLPGDSST